MNASPAVDLRRLVDSARSRKVSMVVARLIARDVAARSLTPGSPLAPEHEMARTFGVGRPSVREALRLLEAQGLVTIRPGQGGGPVVASPGATDFADMMSLYLQIGRTTYRDVMQTSIMIQGLLARQAAQRVAAGHRDGLDELAAASKGQLDAGISDHDFLMAGVRFHEVLAGIAGSHILQLFSAALGHIYAEAASASHGGHWEQQDRGPSALAHVKIARAVGRGRPTGRPGSRRSISRPKSTS